MKSRTLIVVASLLLCLNALVPTRANAETIAIIGTGNVAGALGPEFAAQGHTIVYGSRNPTDHRVLDLLERTGNDATVTSPAKSVTGADIIVLAVPGLLVKEITLGLGDLSGKIIIDPTNPITRTTLEFEHAVATSNAEIIQNAAPDADVVKAFNTLTWNAMIDPDATGGPVSIPLVGNSVDAKKTVATLVEGMGLEAIDLGPVENARWLEGMAILLINNTFGPREAFNFSLRRAP